MKPALLRSLVLLGLFASFSMIAYAQSDASASQAAPVVADGVWLGTLHLGGTVTLRLQLHLDAAGKCTLDSLDQKAMGIPCSVKENGDAVAVEVPSVAGKLKGSFSADRKTLTGTWTQTGTDLPIVLERQAATVAPTKEAMDPAMPPVSVTGLKVVLDRDLAEVLKRGALAPASKGGITVGVVQHGVRRIFSYGTAQPDSVFEIGSITKTFTGLILAQMTEQGSVRLDEPVRELPPPGTVVRPAGAEITLLDLSDQHSGLPRLPDNLHPSDSSNPYADYDAKLLYAFVAKHGVALPPSAPFGYSNLGVGLLGQALADRAKTTYPSLLHDQVTGPLGLRDTAVTLTAEMQSRFITAHDAEGLEAKAWGFDALAGAGGIRSTAADMLTYLEAQLHPDRLPSSVLAAANGKTLPAAIVRSHTIHGESGPGAHIALNWFHDDATGSYSHGGATGGCTSVALFNQERDFAFVVLDNMGPGGDDLANRLAHHIEQRLEGAAAVSLTPAVEQATVHLDTKVLDAYAGSYQLAPNFVLAITREGDQLFVQATGQGKAKIYPESETKFFLKVVDAQITFETDSQGRATDLILHQGGRDQKAARIP